MALASAFVVGVGPAARAVSSSTFPVASCSSTSSSCATRLSSSTTHRCFHQQRRRHQHQHRHSRQRGSIAAEAPPAAVPPASVVTTSTSTGAGTSATVPPRRRIMTKIRDDRAATAAQKPWLLMSGGGSSSSLPQSSVATTTVASSAAVIVVGATTALLLWACRVEAMEEEDTSSEARAEGPVRPPHSQSVGISRQVIAVPTSFDALRWWGRGGGILKASRATECESSSKSPQHFHSAANLFQHHMSKEKEKDDANEYHHDHDDDHDDEHDHDDHEPKAECFLCRVHRQGPCGSLWKDLEACVNREPKGSAGSKGSGNANDPCQSCASQFEGCWKKHAGLYSLIALDEQSQIFQQLKKHMDVHVQETSTSSSGVAIDWNSWKQFVAGSSASHEVVKNYRRRISQNGNIRFRGPLWKRFEKYQMTNPLLVTVVARIPRTIGSVPVKYGVALDQQNRVLGFVEVNAPTTDDKQGSTAKATAQDDDSLQMKIILVPGLTESVKIQLWTVSTRALGGGHRNRAVVHETSVERVDYGASTNSMLAIQNQRTRTQKVK